MTDVFYEQLYKKKKSVAAFLGQIALIALALLIAVALFVVFLFYVPMGQMIGFLAVAGIAYGSYRLNMLFDIEYEYIYLNGEIDFDKIIAKTSRSRIITVKAKNVEFYGVYDDQVKAKFQNSDIKKVLNFDSGNGNKLYYMTTKDKEYGKTLIIFEPEDRIREDFEKRIPRQW